MKSGPKKENMPKLHGPGVSWFAPITNTKPWREPLRNRTGRDGTWTATVHQLAQAKSCWSHLWGQPSRYSETELILAVCWRRKKGVNLWLRMLKCSHVTLVSGTATVHLFSHSLIKGCLTLSIINHISPSVSERGKAIEGKCCVAPHWVL